MMIVNIPALVFELIITVPSEVNDDQPKILEPGKKPVITDNPIISDNSEKLVPV